MVLVLVRVHAPGLEIVGAGAQLLGFRAALRLVMVGSAKLWLSSHQNAHARGHIVHAVDQDASSELSGAFLSINCAELGERNEKKNEIHMSKCKTPLICLNVPGISHLASTISYTFLFSALLSSPKIRDEPANQNPNFHNQRRERRSRRLGKC